MARAPENWNNQDNLIQFYFYEEGTSMQNLESEAHKMEASGLKW